ncbi:MAG: hypothetical protein LBL33_05170 [Tannerella sp.]|nr:hypothetical protein [Tannerella sp.]
MSSGDKPVSDDMRIYRLLSVSTNLIIRLTGFHSKSRRVTICSSCFPFWSTNKAAMSGMVLLKKYASHTPMVYFQGILRPSFATLIWSANNTTRPLSSMRYKGGVSCSTPPPLKLLCADPRGRYTR